MLFPTNKNHVSFSEIKTWKECSYRHKLMYVDKIQTYENNPYAEFGTVVHNAIEDFLKTKNLDVDTAKKNLKECWNKYKFDSPEYIAKIQAQRRTHGLTYRHENYEKWEQSVETILTSLPKFLDETFDEWEFLVAEDQIYEKIDGFELNFKGFIDCVLIATKGKKKKIWIIDWKTTGPRGWASQKSRDFMTQAQVGLYKKYWSKRENVPLKDVGCGYVLLKRNTKPEKCVWFMPVSVGPKFVTRADKLVESMVKTVQKGLFLKNKTSCKFCPFYNTEHCT